MTVCFVPRRRGEETSARMRGGETSRLAVLARECQIACGSAALVLASMNGRGPRPFPAAIWAMVRPEAAERSSAPGLSSPSRLNSSRCLIKHRDDEGEDNPGTRDRSAASGRTMAQIAAGKGRGPRPLMLAKTKAADPQAIWHSRAKTAESRSFSAARLADVPPRAVAAQEATVMPSFIAPQLCIAVSRPPDGEDWVHEIKLDGYRMQLRVENGKVALRTRKGFDWTTKFPEIATVARSLPNAIIDGEVAASTGATCRPATALARGALSEARAEDLTFFAFDLLHANGEDLRSLPLVDRKARLRKLFAQQSWRQFATIRFIEHVAGHGSDVSSPPPLGKGTRGHHLQAAKLAVWAAPTRGRKPKPGPDRRW